MAWTPTDPWTRFALAVFRANAALIEAGEEIVRPLGQTSARWQVLGRIHEPRTVAQLAREIGHARQSVQRVADQLVAERLARYAPHPTDGRTKLVHLTSAGAETMSAIFERQFAWSQGVTAQLDPRQLEQTTAGLAAVSETVEALSLTPNNDEMEFLR